MIALAVGCDVPWCRRTVTRDGVSVRGLRDQTTDLLAVAASRGWWVGDRGRALCPDHTATTHRRNA